MRKASSFPGGAAGMGGSTSQTAAQAPLFYDYRWSTPDKFYYPRDRATANAIWRDIYRRDATISIATDMYAELPWGPFDLEGIDDSSIRKTYEDMFNELSMSSKLPTYTRDLLITGEFIPHLIFSSKRGHWDRIISHNPDYVKVMGLGLALDQPLMWLKPTPTMRFMVQSEDPMVRRVVAKLPPALISAIRANKEIPLDRLNTTYLSRMSTSYDERGTSLYTRIYRFNMYEDFIVNSSLAVSQRNAAPLRMFKLGAADGSWSPTEADVQSFYEQLSIAEADPLAVLITHKNVEVDYVGVADRALLISKEWDFVERAKLLAMGVSKAFLVGETSFACFEKGTKVLSSEGSPRPIEEIENGDTVLDQFGKPQKVLNNWCEGVPDKLLEVTLWGGRKFRVTPNHRFPAWVWPTHCACGCGNKVDNVGRAFLRNHTNNTTKLIQCSARIHEGRHPITTVPEGHIPSQVVEAGSLKVGDFLKIPKTRNIELKDDITPDLARLIGYYLAEGSVAYSPSGTPCEIRLSFGIHERDTWVKDSKEICDRLGIKCKIARWMCKGKLKNSLTVRIIPKNKEFIGIFTKHAGERSHSKKLSQELISWPEELVLEVIKGYFRGDGSRKFKPSPALQKNRHTKTLAIVQCGTVSSTLSDQVSYLLSQLGFYNGKTATVAKDNKRPYHIIRVQGRAATRLCKLVWGENLPAKALRSSVWSDNEFVYIPIKKLEYVDNVNPVYNLEVENTHTYLVCNGIATCNSAIAGLQTLLDRLSSYRHQFENQWIMPKICTPVAEMNEFYKKPKSELEHRIKIVKKEDRQLIVPKLKWRKSLDASEEPQRLTLWKELQQRGILSRRTLLNGAGADIEVERRNLVEEEEFSRNFAKEYGDKIPVGGPAQQNQGPVPFGGSSDSSGRYQKKVSIVNPYKRMKLHNNE